MFGYFKKLSFEDIFNILERRAKEPEMLADGSNSELFFARVSPAENQAFVRNEAGWIRNDLDLIMQMESDNVAASILDSLREIEQKGFPADESPDVIRQSLMSKYQQSPSEITNWIEQQLEFQEIKAEEERLLSDSKLSDEKRAEALKEFKDSLTNEERDIWLKSKRQKKMERMIEEEVENSKSK